MTIDIPDSNIDKVINRLKLKVKNYITLKELLYEVEPLSKSWESLNDARSSTSNEIFDMVFILKYLGIPFDKSILEGYE